MFRTKSVPLLASIRVFLPFHVALLADFGPWNVSRQAVPSRKFNVERDFRKQWHTRIPKADARFGHYTTISTYPSFGLVFSARLG